MCGPVDELLHNSLPSCLALHGSIALSGYAIQPEASIPTCNVLVSLGTSWSAVAHCDTATGDKPESGSGFCKTVSNYVDLHIGCYMLVGVTSNKV